MNSSIPQNIRNEIKDDASRICKNMSDEGLINSFKDYKEKTTFVQPFLLAEIRNRKLLHLVQS